MLLIFTNFNPFATIYLAITLAPENIVMKYFISFSVNGNTVS